MNGKLLIYAGWLLLILIMIMGPRELMVLFIATLLLPSFKLSILGSHIQQPILNWYSKIGVVAILLVGSVVFLVLLIQIFSLGEDAGEFSIRPYKIFVVGYFLICLVVFELKLISLAKQDESLLMWFDKCCLLAPLLFVFIYLYWFVDFFAVFEDQYRFLTFFNICLISSWALINALLAATLSFKFR